MRSLTVYETIRSSVKLTKVKIRLCSNHHTKKKFSFLTDNKNYSMLS